MEQLKNVETLLDIFERFGFETGDYSVQQAQAAVDFVKKNLDDNDATSRDNDITTSRNNEGEKGGNNENSKPQAIDLGLPSGTLWADRNVGAKSPEEYGLYFSWGNIDGHEFGTDYNFEEDYPNTTGAQLTEDFGPEHDAARAYLGEPWITPSSDDFQELCDNCITEMVSVNHRRGMKFTSKINGNSIFFPCSGHGYGTSWLNAGGHGNYWSRSLGSQACGRDLSFYSGGVHPQYGNSRFYGFARRPVQYCK